MKHYYKELGIVLLAGFMCACQSQNSVGSLDSMKNAQANQSTELRILRMYNDIECTLEGSKLSRLGEMYFGGTREVGYVVASNARGKLIVRWKDFDNKKQSREFILSDKDFIKSGKPSGIYYLNVVLEPNGNVSYRVSAPGSRKPKS
ncbi:MAG: hypothetical protein IPP74_06490 [Alphaproteobacteria bacterium]|nr:hypothetical protein [Alphaproteobacteria bacterium]